MVSTGQTAPSSAWGGEQLQFEVASAVLVLFVSSAGQSENT